jgi:hypothetical protein
MQPFGQYISVESLTTQAVNEVSAAVHDAYIGQRLNIKTSVSRIATSNDCISTVRVTHHMDTCIYVQDKSLDWAGIE